MFEFSHGGVIRAPREHKELALIFTGGDFGEGTGHVADVLAEEKVPGSFFFTGGFLEEDSNKVAIRKLIHDGHYLGPHSHEHLLYCPWDDRNKTLVTREQFMSDLVKNITALEHFGVPRAQIGWWIPPYEWYNDEISKWSLEMGIRLFNFSPGTLSNTDYTTDDAKNFRSSDTIWNSILEYEEKQSDGLNGFLLLTHVGAGEKRTDKFFLRLRALVRELRARGYALKRVDDLLAEAPIP
ncbi:polysaccharide deacetylase family protein [Candidatus Sumerlaeota bacterium]|nr:polysaccharide deacetylase family protein [Candidatus Sumerlaeota bacterium]